MGLWSDAKYYAQQGINQINDLNPLKGSSDWLKDNWQRSGGQYEGVDPKGNLGRTAAGAGSFGERGEREFAGLGREANRERDYLRRVARGEDSVSAEQLRQGMQQNIAGQQAMAAGARPGQGAMAARTALLGAGRAASGLAGQQAVAGLQERQQAQSALAQMLMQQRQQELQAGLGGRGLALQGYGGIEGARTSRYGAKMGQPSGVEQGAGILGGLLKTAALF